MNIDIQSLLLGAFIPYAIVFATRAVMLIPGVIKDVTGAIWSVVRPRTA